MKERRQMQLDSMTLIASIAELKQLVSNVNECKKFAEKDTKSEKELTDVKLPQLNKKTC